MAGARQTEGWLRGHPEDRQGDPEGVAGDGLQERGGRVPASGGGRQPRDYQGSVQVTSHSPLPVSGDGQNVGYVVLVQTYY